MADKTINELTAATTMGNDDLLVLQQGGTAKKLSGKQLGDYVYNAAAEKVAEVNQAVDDARSSINNIVESVQSMTELGTDTTLTTTGMAADAKAAGDKIKAVETAALADLSQGTASGSIVTITDGADNIPVKKMSVDIEPVQDLHGYDHPWPAGGGVNLFDPSKFVSNGTVYGLTATINGEWVALSGTYSNEASAVSFRIFHKSDDTKFTHLKYFPDSSSSTYVGSGAGGTADSDYTATINLANMVNGTQYNIKFRVVDYAGETAPAEYTPYSNICPITGWTGAKITKTRKNLLDPSKIIVNTGVSNLAYSDDGITYTTSTSFVAPYVHIPVKNGENVTVKNTQSTENSRLEVRMYAAGTPVGSTITLVSGDRYIFPLSQYDTVDSIRIVFSNATTTGTITFAQPFVEYGDQTVFYPFSSIETYDITFPSEAGTVYGGKLEINEDGSGALTVDKAIKDFGSLNILSDGKQGGVMRWHAPVAELQTGFKADVISSIYASNTSPVGVSGIDFTLCRYLSSVYWYDSRFNKMSDIKQALSGQTIVFPLATPQTYSLTADQVTTLLGTNNVWSDTGDITEFVYRKAPIDSSDVDAKMAAIESMISGRETAMKATKNYTSGSLVIVNDILYRLYANVAFGETLTPGTNCRITTVEAEIAELVPNYRSVNGKVLATDITLTAEDIAYDDSLSEHTSGSVGEVVSDLKESFTQSIITTPKNKNLLDYTKTLANKYLNPNGTIEDLSGRYVTDYIPVVPGKYAIFSYISTAQWAPSIMQPLSTCFYDVDKNVVTGGGYNAVKITPNNAAYVRLTIGNRVASTNYAMVSISDTIAAPESFSFYLGDDKKALSDDLIIPDKAMGYMQTKGNLSDGESLTLPYHNVKINNVLVFTANITSFDKLKIGKEANTYIIIDDTNVTVYNDAGVQTPQAHGLTIENDIQVIIENTTALGFSRITIVSTGIEFNLTTGARFIMDSGSPYVISDGSTLTDCVFTWASRNINTPIWLFGDSYFSWYPERWVYYLARDGFTDSCMLNGYAGESSINAYNALINLLKIRVPNYIVWCIGMNDGDGVSAVNQTWKIYYDAIVDLSNYYGFTLILATIPNTPTVKNNYKNAIIRNSGYRYIDFDKAVDPDGDGEWFPGTREENGVHPTQKGAKILYYQALADLPELTSI